MLVVWYVCGAGGGGGSVKLISVKSGVSKISFVSSKFFVVIMCLVLI